jgi:hypothetical protein
MDPARRRVDQTIASPCCCGRARIEAARRGRAHAGGNVTTSHHDAGRAVVAAGQAQQHGGRALQAPIGAENVDTRVLLVDNGDRAALAVTAFENPLGDAARVVRGLGIAEINLHLGRRSLHHPGLGNGRSQPQTDPEARGARACPICPNHLASALPPNTEPGTNKARLEQASC